MLTLYLDARLPSASVEEIKNSNNIKKIKRVKSGYKDFSTGEIHELKAGGG
jgi:hypothetical protein